MTHESGRGASHCISEITVQPTVAIRKAARRSQSDAGLKPDAFGLYQARKSANTAKRNAGTLAYRLQRRADRVPQSEHRWQKAHCPRVVNEPTNGPPIDRTIGVGVSAGRCMQLAHTSGTASVVRSFMLTRIQRTCFFSANTRTLRSGGQRHYDDSESTKEPDA